MQVREIMSDHVICCTPDTNLKDVAKLMAEHDCGDIPVIQDRDGRKPIGIITDRDITCRAVAEGRNPLELTAQDCMSKPVVTVTPESKRVARSTAVRTVPRRAACLASVIACSPLSRSAWTLTSTHHKDDAGIDCAARSSDYERFREFYQRPDDRTART